MAESFMREQNKKKTWFILDVFFSFLCSSLRQIGGNFDVFLIQISLNRRRSNDCPNKCLLLSLFLKLWKSQVIKINFELTWTRETRLTVWRRRFLIKWLNQIQGTKPLKLIQYSNYPRINQLIRERRRGLPSTNDLWIVSTKYTKVKSQETTIESMKNLDNLAFQHFNK